jgi:hypothetical protein
VNAYAYLEMIIVGVIGLFSAYHVMKLLMPRAVRGITLSMATRFGLWPRALARDPSTMKPAGGCASGCGDGCNGCAVAARARFVPTDQVGGGR